MKLAKMRTSLATNIIGSIVLLMLIFSIIVSTIGYVSFTNAFKREYADTTYHIADTAATLVIADNIDRYLAEGGKSAEYKQTREYLDSYCDKMNVSIVYVIKVDTSDYGRFTSVFNSVGKDTPYTPWEIGYQQDTTNDEYVRIYKDIYENSLKYGTVYRTKDLRGAPPHITTLVPIKDSGGKVVSLMCIQRPMKELDTVRDKYMAKVGFTALGFAVLFALFFASYSRKQFVNPLSKISAEATRFAKENAKGESFEVKSNIHEISALASSIDKMETDMLKYIDNLTSITAEKEKMGAELTIAKTIQENSIPNIFPAFPERAEFDIYASMDPAKEIGGDFYNFFLIDDDHLAFVIGDVSGKGIPAALFMMVTNILVSDRTLMGGTPAEILTFVNNNICDHNKADMFVTLFLAVLEIPTGKIIAANAGHDDAAICKKDGTFELYKTRHNLAVGAMKGVKYKDFEIQLDKGDKLFIYTDGVPEATDKNNSMFTQDRMLRALNENASGTPKDVLKGVRSSVDEFVGDASQFDDLTMLCIEMKDNKSNNMKKIKVDATLENLDTVIDFVDGYLEENECSMKNQAKIDLSLEEIYVNIANYAYGDEIGKAEIEVSREGDDVIIVVKDSGTPYNPLEKTDPDISLSAEERQIGGLGIFLVKKNMDFVSYAYEDSKNIFTMKKSII